MADASVGAQISGNLVAIAAPAKGPTTAVGVTGQAGATDATAGVDKSFGQLVTDSQTAAQPATSDAVKAAPQSDAPVSAPVVGDLKTVQIPTLTPAPAMANIQLTGSAQDLAALQARVEALMQKLQNLQPPLNLNTLTGGDGDAAQLSAALQQLGLSPADAQDEAGKITTALKAFKTKLGSAGVDTGKLDGAALGSVPGGSTLGQIAAMMIAGTPNLPVLDQTATLTAPVTLKIDVTQASGTVPNLASGATNAALGALTRLADVGRAVVGLAPQAASDKTLANGAADATTDEQPLTIALGQTEGTAAVKNAAAKADATLPGAVAATASGVVKDLLEKNMAKSSVSGSAAVAGVSKVAAKEPLGALKGDVLYKWQAGVNGDGTGADSVVATPTAHKQLAGLVKADVAGAGTTDAATVSGGTGGAMVVAGADTPLAQFADKLAIAMRSNVTEQATVQLRGLGQGLQDGSVGAAGTSGNADAGATGGQVRMLLNPPELGEIRIDLTVKDGSVHGTIAASDSAVVSLLAREVHTLKHGLDQAGLKLGEQGINLMLSNSNQQGNQQGNSQQQPNAQAPAGLGGGRLGTELASDELDGTVNALGAVNNPANWVSPDRLVDVRI